MSNYTDLKADVATWAAKTNLTSVLDRCITNAEAKINRLLRVNDMETALAETAIASEVVARPAGLVAIKSIWCTGGEQRTLEQKPLEYIMKQPALATLPQFYAWDRSNLRFYPSSGSVAAVYYTKVPALSGADNWLYSAAPDLYLYATLEQAYIYLHDDANEAKFRALTDGLIQQMNEVSIASQISGGPLVSRVRR
jgi:hypothetical protein